MTKFSKANWTISGNTIHMGVDFSKVDKQNRLVSGFATLDNIDSQKDIVTADASLNAFKTARGNLREMHQNIAVGKVIDFKEKSYVHEGKSYKGIFVTARVSEGAENTWKKVLDGTLTGFSIGGNIIDSSKSFSKEANGNVQIIKAYELVELSLVDNPANPLANVTEHSTKVLSLEVNGEDGSVTAKGMAVEQNISSVLYCENDGIAIDSTNTDPICPICNTKMEDIGWYETGIDDTEHISQVVNKHLSVDPADEGGADMAKFFSKSNEEEVVPAPAAEEEVTADEVIEEESSEEVDEGVEVINKAISELRDVVQVSIEKAKNETTDTVNYLEERFDRLEKAFTDSSDNFDKKLKEISDRIETQKARISDVERSLKKMNSSVAMKKSGNVNDAPVEKHEENSKWNGAFQINNIFE